MTYANATLSQLRDLCRSRSIGADGAANGKTSWVATASRAGMEAALEAHDAGTTLTLPFATAETFKVAGADTSAAAADLLAQAVALLTANRGTSALDESRVLELIREHTRPQLHTIVLDPVVGGSGVNVGRVHKDFERILRILRTNLELQAQGSTTFSPYLYGPPGTGKTTCLMHVFKVLFPELPMETDSYNDAMSAVSIFGYRTQGSGDYVETPFYRAFVNGGGYLGDELDKGSPFVFGALNMALANGQCSFAAGQRTRHAAFLSAFSGNTVGLGPTPMYPDRSVQPGDLRDRMTFVPFGIDESLEADVAATIDDTVNGRDWVRWVREARAYVASTNIPLIITPRATFAGLNLMKAGFTVDEVRDAAVFKGTSTDIRDAVLRGVK